MARGQRCPKCGRLTFQPDGLGRRCSDATCAVVGWLGDGPENSSARGSTCGSCGAGTMKVVVTIDDEAQVYCCFGCSAVYISN